MIYGHSRNLQPKGNKWNFGAGEDAGGGLRRVPPDACSSPGEFELLHGGETKWGLELSPNSKVPNLERRWV